MVSSGARVKGGRQGSGDGGVAIDFLIVSTAALLIRVFSAIHCHAHQIFASGRGSCFLSGSIASFDFARHWISLLSLFFVFVVRRPLLRLYLRARPLKDNWPNSCSADCKTRSSLSLKPVNAACLICCIPLSIFANGFGRFLYRFGGCPIAPATSQHAYLQPQITAQEEIKEEA